MKGKLILLGFVIALAASAQTNIIVFAQLLSPANAILMTNAEFRCYSGKKIFFRNDSGYKSFTAADLNTNVLDALGTSQDKLASQQAALEAANQRYKEQVSAQQAEQARQQQIVAQQKSDAAAKAEAARQKRLADDKERAAHTVIIQPPRGSDLNDDQRMGAF